MWGEILNVLISWAPMLLLIGVWVYFMRSGHLARHQQQQQRHLEEYVVVARRQTEVLERIAAALERRT
jgi:ATP-dependent Zn protease